MYVSEKFKYDFVYQRHQHSLYCSDTEGNAGVMVDLDRKF